mmetsp:Transcript_38368/g.68546  ORF Transcript_38368/g.68546 Transcript_38368/m.68546 type:complete len:485 (-) Transcript_38368:245-1699(-)
MGNQCPSKSPRSPKASSTQTEAAHGVQAKDVGEGGKVPQLSLHDEAQGASYWGQVWDYARRSGPLMVANTLEWYEFGAYAFVADEIAANFFNGSAVMTWGAFASTFIARPVGGLCFGYLSDTFGRKPALATSVWVMAAATVGQGLGPRVSYFGPAWMILCRLGQGLATGGEIGSIIVYLSESPPKAIKGMAIQLLGIGNCLGSALACVVGWGLHASLSPKMMLDWGWRVPFLLATFPAAYAVWTVTFLEETEDFAVLQTERSQEAEEAAPSVCNEVLLVLQNHWPQGLMCMTGMSFMVSLAFLSGMYYKDWLVLQGHSLGFASAALIGGQFLTIAVQPIMGLAVDSYGVATALLGASALGVVLAVPQYTLVTMFPKSSASVIVSMAMGAIMQGTSLSVFLWVGNLFPTEVRGLATGCYYNIGAIVGGFAPMITAALVGAGIPLAPGYYTLASCLLSAVTMGASVRMTQNGGQPLKVAHIMDHPY